MAQVICRYRKADEVRWISHLDLKRTLERAMRRAQLPLALTQGHNPHPKISLGPALPLGATGEAELLAIHLREGMQPEEVKERLNEQLPPGLEVVEAWSLPAHGKRETFGEVDVAEYQVTVSGDVDSDEVRGRVEELLGRQELIVKRGGERPERTVDVRPLILSLSVDDSGGGELVLRMRLRTGSHGGARPQEVAALLGLSDCEGGIRHHRIGLYVGANASAVAGKGVWRRWSRSRGKTRAS